MRDIVIFGAGDIAALASFYFSHDSGRKVAAFTVDAAYRQCERFMDLPLVHHEYGAAGGSIEYLNLMDLGFVPFRIFMIRAHRYAPVWGTFELAGDRIAAITKPDAPKSPCAKRPISSVCRD